MNSLSEIQSIKFSLHISRLEGDIEKGGIPFINTQRRLIHLEEVIQVVTSSTGTVTHGLDYEVPLKKFRAYKLKKFSKVIGVQSEW